MHKVGIDLGGTKIEAVLLDQNLNVEKQIRIDNIHNNDYHNVINNICTIYEEVLKEHPEVTHTVGIGTPGNLLPGSNLLQNCNMLFMNGKPIKSDLELQLKRSIAIDNDANCFALAEATMGAGIGKDVVFGVIMGTGCGGGLIIDQKVIKGLRAQAGEWGHTTINYNTGRPWTSNLNGVVEAYISGTGVEQNYKERFGTGKKVPEIIASYRMNDSEAIVVIDDFLEHFGLSIANLIRFLDPDVIVIGGGLSNIPELYNEGLERVRKYVFNNDLYTPVVKNICGDAAGVLGAAMIGV